MPYHPFDCFTLVRDLPEHGLSAGQVGVVLDEVQLPSRAYLAEFVAPDGSTLALVTIDPAWMVPMAGPSRPAQDPTGRLAQRPLGPACWWPLTSAGWRRVRPRTARGSC